MELLDFVIRQTDKYIDSIPRTERKKYGQFFTSIETAVFMASLFDIPENKSILRILDTGAGTGILSAALIQRLEGISSLQKIYLVCYENDHQVLEVLRRNLDWIKTHSNIQIDYEIRNDNYILKQEKEYNCTSETDSNHNKYDMVIGNPPYMKIGKDAPEAKAMPDICYGAPNLYFLFIAMGVFNLFQEGELVYIVPRSWTSGTYFKRFRKKILSISALKHIHLFVSRNKVFDRDNVLQETIIIKLKKSNDRPKNITITTTQNNKDFSKRTIFKAPYNTVISGEDAYVYLVTDEDDVAILEKVDTLSHTLPSIGLKMRTGLTVDFRHKDELRDNKEHGAVPLFYPQHVQSGKILFPMGKAKEYIVTDKTSLLQNNSNYLFVKRFTTKEERRRLQCGVYLSKAFPCYEKISTQNKINFIGGDTDLSEELVYGLYVIFNSTLYDRYYRILNGSTQVNSTEINSIPIPSKAVIEQLGEKIIKSQDMSERCCDNVLMELLYG